MQSASAFEQLYAFLSANQIAFSVIEHPPEGKSEAVASLRGTQVGQGAKALVCQIRGDSPYRYLLLISAADQKVDFKKLADKINVKRISMASIETVNQLTGCVPGAVPPFSFHEDLTVIADPDLFARFDEIAFNAGSLEQSIKMNSQDYLDLVQPLVLKLTQ